VFCLSARNSEKRIGKRVGYVQQTPARLGTPDNFRCARLVRGELAALEIRRRRTAIIHRTVRWCTGLSSEPTVTSATVVRAIRGRRVARSNGRLGTPDCPVHHPTEGKFGLPSWPPTAPSCLGAIKGTPRRMEETSKHSLSILKHPDSAPAHSLHCVSDLSSI
jgi:hypothetical protein